MPKKTRKKQNTGFKKYVDIVSKFLEKRPVFSFSALTIVLMVGVFMLEQGAEWFKASILDVPVFDGTVMPIQQIPNWAKVGGTNNQLFTSYSSGQLVNIPEYDANQLQSDKTDNDTINAKMTYTVVYMGNYQLDYTENAGSHLAVDIVVPKNTPVYSIANGVVTKAINQNTGFGKHICVQHSNVPVNGSTETIYSCYAHLNQVLVEEGQKVSKGDKIGLSGDTGTATTPHLHFQIDTDEAPWHPWWPFSSTEATAAGLSFFEAINVGLGQSEAFKNTINPMLWVQEHLNYSGGSNASSDDTNDENHTDNTEVVSVETIIVEADQAEIEAGEKVEITVTAKDEHNEIIENFDSSEAEFLATDKTIDLPELNFKSGVANTVIQLDNPGGVTFIVRAGTKTGSTKVTVNGEEKTDEDNNDDNNSSNDNDNSNSNDSNDNDEQSEQPASFELNGESFTKINDSTPIKITAFDENGDKMIGFSLDKNVEIEVDGEGQISPSQLSTNDFDQNGTAIISFTSSTIGENVIKIGSSELEITVIEDAMPVSMFEVEGPDEFTINQSKKITIYTLDEDGAKTPSTFNGTAEISLTEGQGYFSKDELTRDDFYDGKAEIYFTATSQDAVKIKIKSGVILGVSDRISVDMAKEFTDVKETNTYYVAINSLYNDGVINGFSDGTFKPYNNINRAEATKMLLLGLSKPVSSGNVDFTDVEDGVWFIDFLYTAMTDGIVNGFPDNTFRPANNINRAEFFKILLLTADVDADDIRYSPFDDVSVDDWYAPYAKYARDNDLLDFEQGKFEPAKEISRGEVAEALYRLTQK